MEIKHKISKEGRKEGCPFGQKCDQCNLYRATYVKDSGGNVKYAEYDCQINNTAMFVDELKYRFVGVQKATEQTRNILSGALSHGTKRQDTAVGEQATLPEADSRAYLGRGGSGGAGGSPGQEGGNSGGA